MKAVLAEMFQQALRSLDLEARMAALTLPEHRNVKVVAIGKAASRMAACFDRLIGAGRASGLVVPPGEPAHRLPNFEYIVGGHPYPDAGSFAAAHAALNLVRGAGKDSLVVFLISGGGSALFEAPLFDDVPLEDCRHLYETLVTCGANIYEMNVVRKHYSAVKGGRLAVTAWPARQLTLLVSDVPPGKDSTIASGPSMADESTAEESAEIVARYAMDLPPSYRRAVPETPKPGDAHFERSRYLPLLSNQDGVDALVSLARARRWKSVADLSCDDWPLERASEHLLGKLRAMPAPACVVSGGELSWPVTGAGIGGRNQAFVLDCAMRIARESIVVMSAGTDGADGISPAAGAVADGETWARAARAGLDPRDFQARSDSYSFFHALGDTIVTGPTGNNVRDLRILVKY